MSAGYVCPLFLNQLIDEKRKKKTNAKNIGTNEVIRKKLIITISALFNIFGKTFLKTYKIIKLKIIEMKNI